MHNPASDGNFDPPALWGVSEPRPKEKCDRFALSFFDSVESAQARFRSLAKREDAASRYGDHVGELAIVEEDGLMSDPTASGHMDLHPKEGALFTGRVASYAKAAPPEAKKDGQ